MTEKQKETTIFDTRLRDDEYIIWQGYVSAGTNYLHPMRYLSFVIWFIESALFILKKLVFPLLGLAVVFFFIWIAWLSQFWKNEEFPPYVVSILLLLIIAVVVGAFSYSPSPKEDTGRRWDEIEELKGIKNHSKIDRNFPAIPNIWTKNQYVITNQRVLLYEDGRFQETSLILMQDAVKTKPRNGQSDINLYDRRSPTGQLPAPIATLNNLSEEDAETAYDLLVKARGLSFEERIEDLGLE